MSRRRLKEIIRRTPPGRLHNGRALRAKRTQIALDFPALGRAGARSNGLEVELKDLTAALLDLGRTPWPARSCRAIPICSRPQPVTFRPSSDGLCRDDPGANPRPVYVDCRAAHETRIHWVQPRPSRRQPPSRSTATRPRRRWGFDRPMANSLRLAVFRSRLLRSNIWRRGSILAVHSVAPSPKRSLLWTLPTAFRFRAALRCLLHRQFDHAAEEAQSRCGPSWCAARPGPQLSARCRRCSS